MYFSSCVVILAAGSSIATASFFERRATSIPASISHVRRFYEENPQGIFDGKIAVRAAKNLKPPPQDSGKTKDRVKIAADAAKKIQDKNKAAAPASSSMTTTNTDIPMKAFDDLSKKVQANQNKPAAAGAASPMGPAWKSKVPIFKPKADEDRRYNAAADEADKIMTRYEQRHKQSRLAAGLRGNDDMVPPVFNFNTGPISNYNNNDNRGQTITDNTRVSGGDMISDGGKKAGGNLATDGARIEAGTNTVVDNGITDNRMQSMGGSTITGSTVDGKRKGPANTPKAINKRSNQGLEEALEDAHVEPQDFTNLISIMRSNPWAKEEALVEIGNVDGLRDVVEDLIQHWTMAPGKAQLTMNNFAALVANMQVNPAVADAVVDAWNGNLVWASIVEKLLLKYGGVGNVGGSGTAGFTGAMRDGDDDSLLESRDYGDVGVEDWFVEFLVRRDWENGVWG